jgi:hypothetical protein
MSSTPISGKRPTQGLKTFRCHLRRLGQPVALDCLAPTAEAAAFVAVQSLGEVPAWIQVEVREWIPLLREHKSSKVVTVEPLSPPPHGADLALVVGSPEVP